MMPYVMFAILSRPQLHCFMEYCVTVPTYISLLFIYWIQILIWHGAFDPYLLLSDNFLRIVGWVSVVDDDLDYRV